MSCVPWLTFPFISQHKLHNITQEKLTQITDVKQHTEAVSVFKVEETHYISKTRLWSAHHHILPSRPSSLSEHLTTTFMVELSVHQKTSPSLISGCYRRLSGMNITLRPTRLKQKLTFLTYSTWSSLNWMRGTAELSLLLQPIHWRALQKLIKNILAAAKFPDIFWCSLWLFTSRLLMKWKRNLTTITFLYKLV